jgi:hypothetical protein
MYSGRDRCVRGLATFFLLAAPAAAWGQMIPEGTPTLTIGDVTAQEGGGPATVFISLSPSSATPVTVDVFTQNGTALSGSDYTAVPVTTVTFAPNETLKSVAVGILDDGTNEPVEDFTVNLNNAVNAAISRATAVVTLLDNDPFPSLVVSDITVPEGGGPGNFVVSLSQPSGQTITVNYSTQNGSAVAGLDYVSVTSAQLVFSPGQGTRLVPISLIDDAIVEFPETFGLVLSGPANATIADGNGTATISDNDAFYPSDFSRYMDLTIETGDPVGQFYSVEITLDTAALITSGQVKPDGSDLAIAWDATGLGGWIELDAHLRPAPNKTLATSSSTQIWFAIHDSAGAGPPFGDRYRLYYGNPLAVPSVRRRDGTQVYRLFDDFNGSAVDASRWYIHPNYRPAVTVSGGMLHQNGALSPGAIWQGTPIRMISQTSQNVPTWTSGYDNPFAVECRFRSQNISDDVRPVNTFMHMAPPGYPVTHDEYATFLHNNGNSSIRLVRVSNGVGYGLFSSPTVIAPNVWYDLRTTARQTQFAPAPPRALHQLFLNDVLAGDSSGAPMGGYDAANTSGQVGIETDPGTSGDYDWFLVRDFTALEPGLVADPYLNLKVREVPGGTLVEWALPGGEQSFDVIRGQLQFLVAESVTTIDLGAVLCLENDSLDNTTSPDHLDTAMPAAGRAFFYLVRTKTSLTSGSYGHSTAGARQVASNGDCP